MSDPLQKNQVRTPDSTDSSNISSLNMKTAHRPISTSEFNTSGCEEKDLEESRIPTITMSFQDFRLPLHRLCWAASGTGGDDSPPHSNRVEGEYGIQYIYVC